MFSDTLRTRFIQADATVDPEIQFTFNTFEHYLNDGNDMVCNTDQRCVGRTPLESRYLLEQSGDERPNSDTLRRGYAVADRNNFDGVTVDAFTGANNNTVGITEAVPNVATRASQQHDLYVGCRWRQSGDVINRYNGQNRNGLLPQFAAASPTNYFANDRAGGTTGNLVGQTNVPDYVPFSGTDAVGQAVVPTLGDVTSVVADDVSVFAFTSLGEIYQFNINTAENNAKVR